MSRDRRVILRNQGVGGRNDQDNAAQNITNNEGSISTFLNIP